MNKLISLCTASILATLAVPASASIISVAAGSLGACPTVGAATACAVAYRFNADGSVDTLTDSTISSTDGIEDTLVGIINNSGGTLNSLTLNGVGTGGVGVFDFDGDGQSTVANPGSGLGDTYFGKYFNAGGGLLGTTTFSGIGGPGNSMGTIDFAGLTNGGSGWFVLEDQIDFSAPPTVGSVPLPAALPLMFSALGFGGIARRRQMQKKTKK